MPKTNETTAEERQELLDLADDVDKAAWLAFHLGHDDRAPDGDRLSDRGKKRIADALRFHARHLKE